jgi:hypothetical protein
MYKFILITLALLATFGVSEAAMKQAGVHEPGTGLEKPLLKETNRGTGNAITDEIEVGVTEKGNANKVSNQGEANQIRTMEQEEGAQKGPSEMALQKRSEVANQVQELLKLADRVGGIGEQVRAFAQAQNENIEKIEKAVSEIRSRNGFARFFVGVKTDKVEEAENLLNDNKQKLEVLKNLKTEIKKAQDLETFENAVNQIEEYIKEADEKVKEEVKGFSLFGWLFK